MLGLLRSKGFVERRSAGKKFIYTPRVGIDEARESALDHVVETFFDGSEEALVTLLVRRGEVGASGERRDRLLELIRQIEEAEAET